MSHQSVFQTGHDYQLCTSWQRFQSFNHPQLTVHCYTVGKRILA